MKRLLIGLCLLPLYFIGQTKDEVLKELKKQNVKHPEIVLAQSILETGWYKCKSCSRDQNNLFGLYNSKTHQYFSYNKWEDSIGGYLRGIQYRYNTNIHKNYYEFLTNIGYAEDPDYINKLKLIVKNINNEKDTK